MNEVQAAANDPRDQPHCLLEQEDFDNQIEIQLCLGVLSRMQEMYNDLCTIFDMSVATDNACSETFYIVVVDPLTQ